MIGNKKRMKVMMHCHPNESWGSVSFISVYLYNNNFASRYKIRIEDGIWEASFLNYNARGLLATAKRKLKDSSYPVITGFCEPNQTIRAIISTAKQKSKLDQVILGTYLLEKVNYYGKINKIIKKYAELQEDWEKTNEEKGFLIKGTPGR